MKKSKPRPDSDRLEVFDLNTVFIARKFTALALCVFSVVTCSAATFELPDATISGLTHTFGHFAPGGPTTQITDMADTRQFTQPGFSTTLTGSETLVLRFEAPVGQKFVIHAPPSGFGNVSLALMGQWWGASSDTTENPVAKSFTFENLVGTAPLRTYSYDIMGSSGSLISFTDIFTVAPGTEFTAVELSASYAFNIANPSTTTFSPDYFRFEAVAASFSQILGDGTLMTLEAVPEPTSLALIVFSIGAYACLRRYFSRPTVR